MKCSLSHTVWEYKCHVVWGPKNSGRVIYGKLKSEIGLMLRNICKYKVVEVFEGMACFVYIRIPKLAT